MVYKVQVGTHADMYMRIFAHSRRSALEKVRDLLGEDWPEAKLRILPFPVARHETVGQRFRAPLSDEGSAFCRAWDWRTGFWMEFANGARRAVSERAIGRTYHRLWSSV